LNESSDYPWLVWKFPNVPNKFWQNEENNRKYFDWLTKKLNIECAEDWSRVTAEQLNQMRGSSLIMKNGGIFQLLAKYYPDFSLESILNHQKNQRDLLRVVKEVVSSLSVTFRPKLP
jgi:hypothetical protein